MIEDDLEWWKTRCIDASRELHRLEMKIAKEQLYLNSDGGKADKELADAVRKLMEDGRVGVLPYCNSFMPLDPVHSARHIIEAANRIVNPVIDAVRKGKYVKKPKGIIKFGDGWYEVEVVHGNGDSERADFQRALDIAEVAEKLAKSGDLVLQLKPADEHEVRLKTVTEVQDLIDAAKE